MNIVSYKLSRANALLFIKSKIFIYALSLPAALYIYGCAEHFKNDKTITDHGNLNSELDQYSDLTKVENGLEKQKVLKEVDKKVSIDYKQNNTLLDFCIDIDCKTYTNEVFQDSVKKLDISFQLYNTENNFYISSLTKIPIVVISLHSVGHEGIGSDKFNDYNSFADNFSKLKTSGSIDIAFISNTYPWHSPGIILDVTTDEYQSLVQGSGDKINLDALVKKPVNITFAYKSNNQTNKQQNLGNALRSYLKDKLADHLYSYLNNDRFELKSAHYIVIISTKHTLKHELAEFKVRDIPLLAKNLKEKITNLSKIQFIASIAKNNQTLQTQFNEYFTQVFGSDKDTKSKIIDDPLNQDSIDTISKFISSSYNYESNMQCVLKQIKTALTAKNKTATSDDFEKIEFNNTHHQLFISDEGRLIIKDFFKGKDLKKHIIDKTFTVKTYYCCFESDKKTFRVSELPRAEQCLKTATNTTSLNLSSS